MVSWFEGPVRLAQDLRAKKQTRTFCRCQLSGTWQPDQWPDGIRVEGRAGVGKFPMNFATAPIMADLFLLAIGAIGGKEVRQGTLGANNISPLDIMLFFITLAYIAISIDASGLIRFLAFKDLSSPRAWIFSQFAAANIGSAVLVSSNPTNLVLSGAFGIKFIHYTANMVVPTVITALVLYPILLYLIFTEPGLIPRRMTMYQLPSHLSNVPPANPNIPAAKDLAVTELSHRAPREAGQTASAQDGDSSRDLLYRHRGTSRVLGHTPSRLSHVLLGCRLWLGEPAYDPRDCQIRRQEAPPSLGCTAGEPRANHHNVFRAPRRKRPRTLVGSCRELVDWLRSHISCYHGRLVASSLGTHPFRLCHVCARAGAGVEALGGHVCVRVETLGRQDGRCRWYRRHGISICRSVLPAPTLALRFSCRASSRHGRRYIASAARRSTAAPFGPRCTAWPLASTMVPLAQRSAHRWPGCCGATFSRGRILRSPTSTLRGSICRSSACP
ncbi:arsenite efflux transporter [Verticillium dahliae]